MYLPVKIAATSTRTVGSFYTMLKDNTEMLYRCNMVYDIPCRDCEGHYIGMTGQRFKTRREQHERNVKKRDTATALSKHTLNTGHVMDFNNATILSAEKYYTKRAFK